MWVKKYSTARAMMTRTVVAMKGVGPVTASIVSAETFTAAVDT